jgi:tetratricopeptide (TPR) repeat protein
MLKRTLLLLAALSVVTALTPACFAKSDVLNKAKEAASHEEWDQAAQLAQQAVTEDQGDDDAWTVLGRAQMALGDTAAGITDFEKAVQLNPRQPNAVLELTDYYLKTNRGADAERVVVAAEEKDTKGKIDEIKVARGEILAQNGDMAQATMLITSATAKNPKNPLYPQILARIYQSKNVAALAEKYYADAWALAPGNPTIAYEYALVLQGEGKYNDALALFKVVQDKDPKNKTVDYLIGRLYYAADRYQDAYEQFQKAVEKRPDHFLSWYLLGKSDFEYSKKEKQNKYADAEQSLRKALQLKPDRKDVLSTLAEVVFTRSRLYYQLALADTSGAAVPAYVDSSISFAKETLKLDSTVDGVYSQIARCWSKLGNLDSTVFYSKLQLSKTPGDQIEFARLVNALQRRKDKAGKSDPDNAGLVEVFQPVYDKLDWTLKKAAGDSVANAQDKFIDKYAPVFVNALIETGKTSSARDMLKQMLGYDASWCDGYNLSAYMDMKRKNYPGALPILQVGVQHCPRNADLWNSLGDCLYFQTDKPTREMVKKARAAWAEACDLGNHDACDKFDKTKQ